MSGAYYNENDPFAAAWLRELIKEKLIADGEVDDRSIELVRPDDLRGFVQCHFFAGIGGWSYALRLASWGDSEPVWTGSCPCQPFSVAGKGEGTDDPRDLWPAWQRLIAERRPPTIFGEQTSGADGLLWLDRVYVDLEASAYAVAAADLCAAGATAPHLRQRLYFVADAGCTERWPDAEGRRDVAIRPNTGRQETPSGSELHGANDSRLADAQSERTRRLPVRQRRPQQAAPDAHGNGNDARMADADSGYGFWWSGPLQVGRNAIEAEVERGGRRYRAQWRIKPGLSLLAHGVPRRVAKLCGLGNAIVPQVAQAFIEAYIDARGE
jgi:DNA (cytosine-5)-methyltransferase 1